jgi:hypothetical protein
VSYSAPLPPVPIRIPAHINLAVLIEDAAMVAHEANRAYCLLAGDTSHRPWPETPEQIRASVRDGVRGILADPSTSPESSHERWLAYKVAEGWVYGPVKDYERKLHPCLRPYAELSEHHRRKDVLFRSVVLALVTQHP